MVTKRQASDKEHAVTFYLDPWPVNMWPSECHISCRALTERPAAPYYLKLDAPQTKFTYMQDIDTQSIRKLSFEFIHYISKKNDYISYIKK